MVRMFFIITIFKAPGILLLGLTSAVCIKTSDKLGLLATSYGFGKI